MFAIPGILALVAFIYGRMQEFVEVLRVVPLLHVFFALAAFGIALDLRIGASRPKATPQFLLVGLFFVWCLCTVAFSAPTNLASRALELAVCVALYLVIAHGVQSFRALHVVAGLLLGLVLMVAAVGVHQGFAPESCIVVDESVPGDTTTGKPDGRPCTTPRECYLGSAEPGAHYLCEHVGLFGTTSIDKGRVRYRGVLQDPNELALAVSIGLPLAFAFAQLPGRYRWPRRLLMVLALGLVLMCAILTRSRGGQLVFLAVLAAYFVQRFGWRGAIPGGVLALPLLLLGGRSGAEASASTLQRTDCWYEALSMWRSHPLTGVGFGQFGEYHYLTAHNSYLLTLAELGLLGMLLFSAILYVSLKIPLTLLRQIKSARTQPGAAAVAVLKPWAMALIAAFSGLMVGIFFLSFAYHYVLWIYVGLAGALYSAIRRHDPSFKVSFGWRDLGVVAAVNLGIIVFVFFYTRWALA
jgi:O-antigen ligase